MSDAATATSSCRGSRNQPTPSGRLFGRYSGIPLESCHIAFVHPWHWPVGRPPGHAIADVPWTANESYRRPPDYTASRSAPVDRVVPGPRSGYCRRWTRRPFGPREVRQLTAHLPRWSSAPRRGGQTSSTRRQSAGEVTNTSPKQCQVRHERRPLPLPGDGCCCCFCGKRGRTDERKRRQGDHVDTSARLSHPVA